MATLQQTRGASASIARWARFGYLLVAWAVVAMVVIQVFLIGMTLFVSFNWLPNYIAFGHSIGLVILLLFILALIARLPRRSILLTLLLVVLFSLQYAFVNLASAFGTPVMGAFHSINALAIFWLAVYLARQALGLLASTPAAKV
jgi:hypothetical protein